MIPLLVTIIKVLAIALLRSFIGTLAMRTHKRPVVRRRPASSGLQWQAPTPRDFEVTYPGQDVTPALAPQSQITPAVQTTPVAESSTTSQSGDSLTGQPMALYREGQVPPQPLPWPRPQAKLTVGQPNDPYEQEADRMAARVLSMPEAATQPPGNPVQPRHQTMPTVQMNRMRRGAISVDLGGGVGRIRNLAQVRQMTPEQLELAESPSSKSEAEETADSVVDGVSDAAEFTGGILEDQAIKTDSTETGANALGAVGGILGLYQAVQQLREDGINAKIEGIFGMVGSLASSAESGAEIAKGLSEEASSTAVGAEIAAAVGGTVGDGIQAIKGLVLTIKDVYDAYKAATSEEGSSTGEKIATGLTTVRGLVEVAGNAVSAGKTIVDMLQQASGGLAQAVPGLSIALSAVNIAIEVFHLIKAKTSEQFVKSVLASNSWEQSRVFGQDKERRQQQSQYAKTYAEEIQKMKLKLGTLTDPRQIAELQGLIKLAERQQAALLENLSLSNLAETNSDRVTNAGFAIGVEMTKIVGDVLTLVPEPNTQVAAMSLKIAAGGASLAYKGGQKAQQFLRDQAANNPDSFLNRVMDTTQSTNAKAFRRKETAKYIFGQVAALPEPQAPEFLPQKDRIEQLIEAAGVSPQALYRTVRTSGLDEAIRLLVKVQGE